MPIQYPEILGLQETGRRFSYGERDTILYALAVGLGADPLNADELRFVYERELLAVPTLATVVAWGSGVSTDRLGVNYTKVLHGEEEIVFHRPMPAAAELITDSGVEEVFDKGPDRGAVIQRRTVLRDAQDGAPIATIRRGIFARADGGCGGSKRPAPIPHATPERPPDRTIEVQTRPDQAALYRLCGDRNPLHIDPQVAARAGFQAPILHGLCTYGIACRVVLQAYCDYDPARIFSHAARFSAPVLPGDRLRFDLWRDDHIVSFEASCPARAVTVLKNGRTLLRD